MDSRITGYAIVQWQCIRPVEPYAGYFLWGGHRLYFRSILQQPVIISLPTNEEVEAPTSAINYYSWENNITRYIFPTPALLPKTYSISSHISNREIKARVVFHEILGCVARPSYQPIVKGGVTAPRLIEHTIFGGFVELLVQCKWTLPSSDRFPQILGALWGAYWAKSK